MNVVAILFLCFFILLHLFTRDKVYDEIQNDGRLMIMRSLSTQNGTTKPQRPRIQSPYNPENQKKNQKWLEQQEQNRLRKEREKSQQAGVDPWDLGPKQ
jgi:hypothetical protein